MFFWRYPSKFFLGHCVFLPNTKVLMIAFFFCHSFINLLGLELLLSPLSTAVVFTDLAAASVRQTFITDNNIFFNQFRLIVCIFHMHPFACFHYLWLLHTDTVCIMGRFYILIKCLLSSICRLVCFLLSRSKNCGPIVSIKHLLTYCAISISSVFPLVSHYITHEKM